MFVCVFVLELKMIGTKYSFADNRQRNILIYSNKTVTQPNRALMNELL